MAVFEILSRARSGPSIFRVPNMPHEYEAGQYYKETR
jgi:hypothetical protein